MIKTGSDFSGVGAFDQALIRLGIDYKTVYACDWDKYSRQTYIHNYGEPDYYPEDVYDREIPEEPLDIYMTSPPCFTGETLINTASGFKPIKEISIGDYVLTHRNRYQKVIDFGSKKSEVYSLKAQGIIETKTTSNHRYLVRERYREWNNKKRCDERKFTEPKWVEVKDLNKNHFIGINIPQINENPLKINRNTAYVLGRYVADGWLRDRTKEDSINFSAPNSETRRGRVEKGVAQTLDTACNQGVMIDAFRGRNPKDLSDRTTGAPMEQRLGINQNGTSNTLTSVQKDNVVVYGNLKGGKWDKTHEQSRRVYSPEGIGATLHTMGGGNQHPKIAVNDVIQLNQSKESGGKQPYQHNRVYADYGVMTTLDCDSGRKSVETNFRIRRLTVRECFRLMDFPDTFTWPVSNSQAYKQAGNSICVGVLAEIIKKLNL